MKIALLGLFLLGCGPATLPAPRVAGITPQNILASDNPPVTVTVSAVLPFHANYGAEAITVDPTVQVWIGPYLLSQAPYANGTVTGTLPFQVDPGTYDVSIKLADGRTGTLAKAFVIQPGLWPTGYSFDPIPTELSGQPFGITVRAQGANAATFNGVVTLNASPGQITPTLSSRFVNGVLVQTVTVTSAPTSNMKLTATDAQGNTGTSNKFTLL